MSETTIEWTATRLPDGTVLPGYSFNPWIGCTEVGPGCRDCYARTLARRLGVRWGPGERRRPAGDKYWEGPLKWNAKAKKTGIRRRVFCASMADVFDNEGLAAEREWLWELIEETPCLDWLLLTKRVGNVMAMVPSRWHARFPSHVWVGATMVNQYEVDRDITKLTAIPAAVRFISFEPLLGAIYLPVGHIMTGFPQHITRDGRAIGAPLAIQWAIAGGESGHTARPVHPEWIRSLRDQCVGMGVPFHFKQWGAWKPISQMTNPESDSEAVKRRPWTVLQLDGTEETRFPPGAMTCYNLGKRKTGRTLDGRTWDEFPRSAA